MGLLLFVLLSLLPAGCAWVRETSIRAQGGGKLLAAAEKALQQGRHGSAEESFRKFLLLYPNHSEAPKAKLWLRALAEIRELRSLLEASARRSREEETLLHQVAALAERGAYEEALALLQKNPAAGAKAGGGGQGETVERKFLIGLLRDHLQTRAELAKLRRVRDELKRLYLRLEKLRSPSP
ncbi:MAG: hypothetical protein ACE5JJ_03270 [Nitrospinota bacterium]